MTGQRREASAEWRHLHERHVAGADRPPQAQEEAAELLAQVTCERQHGAARPAGVRDRGSRQGAHQLGGQAVAQLRVDVVGADEALGQLHPGVLILAAEPGAPQNGHRRWTVTAEGMLQSIARRAKRGRPRHLRQLGVLAQQRHVQPIGTVDGLEAEPVTVDEPAVITPFYAHPGGRSAGAPGARDSRVRPGTLGRSAATRSATRCRGDMGHCLEDLQTRLSVIILYSVSCLLATFPEAQQEAARPACPMYGSARTEGL